MPGFIESVYLLLYKYMNDIIKGVYRLASNINWNLLNRFNCYKRLEPTLICLNSLALCLFMILFIISKRTNPDVLQSCLSTHTHTRTDNHMYISVTNSFFQTTNTVFVIIGYCRVCPTFSTRNSYKERNL